MTCIWFMKLLLFLFLNPVCSQEPEPVFKAEGTPIELGYCFGVDYIVVYRIAPEGDQLLGNSSNKNMPNTPPADLQGRISFSEDPSLLGLRISNLTHMDSGTYKRECWQNQTLVNQHSQQVSVCNEEIESEEIIVKTEGGGADLFCNSTSIGLEGTSVYWYYEMYPLYRPTLFLDSSVSLEPLVDGLQGLVEVRDNGALLIFDNTMLKDNQHFYCLVVKGTKCLSFMYMYPPDHSERSDIFASPGDRVVLSCPADGDNRQWETPLGGINSSTIKNDMHISEDFSLVIDGISDEHSGDYSCISPSLEVQYSLALCPKNKSQEKVASKGGDVSLECRFGQDKSQRVLWHRHDSSGQFELIHDSKDEAVALPDDLRSRLTVLEDGFLLTISDLELKDGGTYWCVVLKSSEFLEGDEEYKEDYDNDDGVSDDQYWDESQKCIFKQETILTMKKEGRGVIPGPETFTPKPSEASNVTAYAVGGALVGLLVVGVIIGVIVMKRRAKASPPQGRHTAHSTVHVPMDIQVDPDCTESLTANNGVA